MAVIFGIGNKKNWRGVEIPRTLNLEDISNIIWENVKDKKKLNDIILNLKDKKLPIFLNQITKMHDKIYFVNNNIKESNHHYAISWIYLVDFKKNKIKIFINPNVNNNIDDIQLVDEYDLNKAEPNWTKVEELSNLIIIRDRIRA